MLLLLNLDLFSKSLKKIIHHPFGGGPDQTRADGRDQSAYLGIGIAKHFGLISFVNELNAGGAFDEARPALALKDQGIRFWRFLVPELDFADIVAFHSSDPDFQMGIVITLSGLDDFLAPIDGALKDDRIGDAGENFFARSGDGVAGREFHLVESNLRSERASFWQKD